MKQASNSPIELRLVIASGATVACLGLLGLAADATWRAWHARPSRAPSAHPAVPALHPTPPKAGVAPRLVAMPDPLRPGGASARAASSAPPEPEPPADEGEVAARRWELEHRWETERRDAHWASDYEIHLASLLDGEHVASGMSRVIECHASLCKVDLATTAIMALEGLSAVQRRLEALSIFTEPRDDGNPHLIVFVEVHR